MKRPASNIRPKKQRPDSQAPDNTPDPLAIALQYKAGDDPAPRITAKGKGWVAEQILEIAKANDIEIREDADLAELLSMIDVGSEIPVEAFAAVAEILAYIYRSNDAQATDAKQNNQQAPQDTTDPRS